MRNHFKNAVYLALLIASSTVGAGSYDDFFVAIIRDDVSTVRSLLARGMDPNSRDPKGQPALAVAIRRESPRAFAALLARSDVDVNAQNAAGESALMLAAIAGDLDACQQLLERGALVRKSGWAPIHYAASGPETRIVRLLLDRGAEIDAEAPNGTTALMLAAQTGPESTVEFLLARGADTRRRNQRGLQAIDFAEQAGRDWLVERLEKLPR
ncbi:ankyrin repeat domain-containing protein [Variovorax sp. YR752]|uniref:ankyrin repeat domain-containing protein n=1 Tax=Variovorax sp. YR752 TaxID=1884383 RepID=UPI0031381FFA